ncbi:hypothetical protein [Arabidopsis thaliana]|uniref:T3H13.8 protein n=1 Tax=Arabidopsis thaliana TaxID=3702 RepID=Q9ZPF3_ARATH|nr:T3H13.8 gene product [Arabidopsis thaliana]CAB78012.1 hypothetical protein [Arabidopsis thaliana]
MWIVFGGHPIRFGLREFSILTGLECGKYPKKKDVDDVISVKPECESVWKTLFDERFGDTVPTIADLVSWLQEEESMEGWKQLALSLIILVDGVVAAHSNPNRPTSKTVEMTKNLEFFCKYPWGRVSFTRTLGRIANFQTPYDAQQLIRGLLVGSYALHGFPLALQLLAFETIPSIAKLGPDDVPNRTFAERSIHRLASLRAIRTSRILECEAADEVEVNYIVKPADNVCPPSLSWDDEVDDPRVDYIEALLIDGHQWQEDDWVGGYARVPKQVRPPQLEETDVKRKRNAPGLSPKEPAMKIQKSEMDCDKEENAEDCFGEPVPERFIVEMRRSFKELEDQMYQMHEDMKDFVRDQIRAAPDPKGKRTEQTIPSHDSREPPTSMDKAPVTGKKPSRRMSTKGSTGTRKSSRLTRVSHDVDTPALSVGCNSKEEDKDVPGVHTTAVGGRSKPSKPKKNVFFAVDTTELPDSNKEDMQGFIDEQYGANNESDFTANDGLDSSAAEEEILDTGFLIVPYAGSTQSHLVCRLLILLTICLNGVRTYSLKKLVKLCFRIEEMLLLEERPVEEATVDTEMEEVLSNVSARVSEVDLLDNGPKDVAEPGLVGTHTRADEIADADIEMVDNPSGLPSTSAQEEARDASASTEANGSESEETYEPSDGDTTHIPGTSVEAAGESKLVTGMEVEIPEKPTVIRELDTKAVGDLAAATDVEVVMEEPGIVEGSVGTEDPNPGSDEADKTDIPKNNHLEMMAMLMWHKNGEQMIANRCIVLDMMLTHLLTKRVGEFKKCINKNRFKWGKLLSDIANGVHINREPNMKWLKDVDVVYAPMNWKSEHWVALGINLNERLITVYDALISHTRESAVKARMTPICEMMPYLVRAMCQDVLISPYSVEPFEYVRCPTVAQNPTTGDCGPYTMKFLELLAFGHPFSELTTIREADMVLYRQKYSVDIYEHGKREAAKKMADKCWWYLGPMLKSGPRGRDIVYRPDVLKDANIFSMCDDPDDFYAAGHDPNDINSEGRYRPFFKRCLQAGNPTAIYHEGLRLVTHESDIQGAILHLERIAPRNAAATLACAILYICAGNSHMGGVYLRLFGSNHYAFESEEARDICEEALEDIKKYGNTLKYTYANSFSYLECGDVNTLEVTSITLSSITLLDVHGSRATYSIDLADKISKLMFI